MGIDIGFTDRSLADSKYALCASLRRNTAAVYVPLKQGEADLLAEYRDVNDYLNLKRLREEAPGLYGLLSLKDRLFFLRDEVRWDAHARERFTELGSKPELRQYVERRAEPWIRVDRIPKPLRRRVLSQLGEDEKLSAWYAMPYQEQTEHYCKGCPIRPLSEVNCYLRFSSYPGMNAFREGFLVALLHAQTINEDKLKEAWFSFPHLDRSRSELPKIKLEELRQMVEGEEVKKGPEMFFNDLVSLLEKVLPKDAHTQTEEIDLDRVPFVDEFISAFIYREEPYSRQDARKFLPYFETLREVSDWAIWETDNPRPRHSLISFRERIGVLLTALQVADKYDVKAYMSY